MPRRLIRGCDYYVEEAGTGQDTIIFLHGLFMSGRAWHNQVLALRNRFRCVSIDLRGHSRSSSPGDGYAMDDLADDIVQLMQAAGYGACHVVGCAMGSTVAMHLALRRPELVRSLTLIAATADGESGSAARLWLSGVLMQMMGLRPFAGTLMRRLFGGHFLRDDDRRIQVDHWRTEFRKHDAGVARALRAYARRDDLNDVAGRIRAPTLIVSGGRDTIRPPAATRALNELMSGSRFVTCPEAAHCPPVETPDEVSEALTGFLSSLKPRRG